MSAKQILRDVQHRDTSYLTTDNYLWRKLSYREVTYLSLFKPLNLSIESRLADGQGLFNLSPVEQVAKQREILCRLVGILGHVVLCIRAIR